jgi:hypothetical protein
MVVEGKNEFNGGKRQSRPLKHILLYSEYLKVGRACTHPTEGWRTTCCKKVEAIQGTVAREEAV